MAKRLSVSQLKKELGQKSEEEVISFICTVYKKSKEAQTLINIMLGNTSIIEDRLNEAKKKIRGQFYTNSGGYRNPNLRECRSIISSFEKVYDYKQYTIDLRLYYVECGVEYTNDLGDIYDSFYNSLLNAYENVINTLIDSEDWELAEYFMPRLDQIVDDTGGIGFGFHDELSILTRMLKKRVAENRP